MSRRRVVISGIGAFTPIGHGAEGLWAGVRRGQSVVRRVTRFDPSPFRSHLAAEIDDFDPVAELGAKRARRLDRFSQLSVATSLQAIRDAGLVLDARLREAAGCYLGSALGGVVFGEEQHAAYLEQGPGAVSPWLALSVFGGAGAANVAIELGLHGPNAANGNSCAAGALAIGGAYELVRDGATPVMLAGGAEAPLAPLTFGAFAIIRAMSSGYDEDPPRASRPFDVARDGFVMGEGAATVVLEDREHALARGARPYAEIRGFGTTNDGYHMTAPLPDGSQAARAICRALADAELGPADVDYVNAHASATPLGDSAEAAAICLALGERAAHVPTSGTKGLYGHPLGASGAIETAIAALAIDRGWLPGTINLSTADPAAAGLALIGPEGREARPRVVLNDAFGFGGTNISLVLTAAT
ncbi:MAG: beta-ketoacyl-[acyl-carrier-protein] synthase family protein [Chloroflexi bacterium]|nr:beta-ketoacyl-[acyl-carrier-protein] synthase family protein [Chloroflexota bacterium]